MISPVSKVKKALASKMLEIRDQFNFTITNPIRFINNQYHHLKDINDPSSPNAPDLSNFDVLLSCWGIRESQIINIIIKLICQAICLALFGCISIYLVFTSVDLNLKTTGLIFFLLGTFSTLATIWRIHILHFRQYLPFKDWITLKW